MNKFSVACSRSSTWKVNVIVWPTHKKLIEARNKIDRCCNEPLAFFHDCSANRKLRIQNWSNNLIGTCHFFKGKGLTLGNVIHESTHAATAYAYTCRLDIYGDRNGEEEFVKSVQHISTAIWSQVRRK